MLKGKVALVTGGAGGIGEAIVRTYAREGAAVAIQYHTKKEKALALKQEIIDAGGKAEIFSGDVSDFQDCQALIEGVVDTFGRIDILVNNAGITRDALVVKMTEEAFDEVIDTNLKGCFNTIHFAAKEMIGQKSGRIINISSVSGVGGNFGQANYSAAKAGLIGMTKSVAKEMASRGVLVNAIAPGFVETPMTEGLPEKVKERALMGIPVGRFAKPQDIANVALFLACDLSSYMTGQTLLVDGGIIM